MQVTINIPAEKDRQPPRFDSSEFGDSWWSVLTKVQAMFTELFGVGAPLPNAQYTTAALQSAPMTGAQVAGAKVVVFDNTGTTPGNLQMPIATDLVAAIPGAAVGERYILKIRNSSGAANTATITTNTGITLVGTMTIAQNVTREFVVTLTSLTAVTRCWHN
jgi:hypothetical protein